MTAAALRMALLAALIVEVGPGRRVKDTSALPTGGGWLPRSARGARGRG